MNKKELDIFLQTLESVSDVPSSSENPKTANEPSVNLMLDSGFRFDFSSLEQKKDNISENLADKTEDEEKFYINHRERVKERFLSGDPSSFLDYDLLEMILFFIIPRKDVKPLAKKMIDHFQNLRNIINADEEAIKLFINNTKNIKFFFKLISEIALRIPKTVLKTENTLSNWGSLIEYLEQKIGHLSHEEFHILCLDTKYRLIDDMRIGTGTIDEVTVYTRDIVKKILAISTKYIVLAHNHPSGKSDPSSEDIDITENINKAISYIDIVMLDHVIIAKDSDKHFSFKANFLI